MMNSRDQYTMIKDQKLSAFTDEQHRKQVDKHYFQV